MKIVARIETWALVAAVGLVACGGSSSTPPAKSSGKKDADEGVIRPVTQAQLPVAHYATGDGNVGFVLDRTREPARIRMDGEKDVIELTKVEQRDPNYRKGFDYLAPDGTKMLFISVGGDIQVFTGRDSFWVNSDKKAEPLGNATVAGQYVAKKTAKQSATEAVAQKSVVTKLSMKPEDSENLAKVGSAIASAPKELFVRLTPEGASSAKWTPNGTHSYSTSSYGESTWDKTKTGYAKYGGRLVGTTIQLGAPNRLHTETMREFPTSPAPGTPGLVWSVDGSLVTFVTLDGGRYVFWLPEGDKPAFEDGAGSPASWPPPLQHSLLSVQDTHDMAKVSAIPAQTAKELDALDDGWWSCINEVWKKADADIKSVERTQASMKDKYGKASGIAAAAEQDAPKKCAPAKKAIEDGLVKVIEARNAERTAIHEKARARLR